MTHAPFAGWWALVIVVLLAVLLAGCTVNISPPVAPAATSMPPGAQGQPAESTEPHPGTTAGSSIGGRAGTAATTATGTTGARGTGIATVIATVTPIVSPSGGVTGSPHEGWGSNGTVTPTRAPANGTPGVVHVEEWYSNGTVTATPSGGIGHVSTAEWHWNGSATPRPTAREIDFTAEPTSGTAPLTVTVTSDTTIPVDRRVWLFTYRGERGGIGLGGNVTAAARVETVQLPRPGVVTVRLVETVDGIDSVKEKVDYITVRAVPGHAV